MPTKTERAIAFYKRGLYYYGVKNWSDAIANLRDAIKLLPDHIGARLHLGAALARDRQYLEAVKVLEDGRHFESVDRLSMLRLLRLISTICVVRQDLPAAEYYLRRALEIDPGNVGLGNKLAQVLCQSGNFDDGFDIYVSIASPKPS